MFRLMTTNLLHERGDASDFAGVISRLDPDVLVVQELGPLAAAVVAGAYPNHRLRPALDYSGRGIATRFDAEFGDLDMAGRRGVWANVDVEGRTVRVAGVHFLNPIHFPWWSTARARGAQLGKLFDWLDLDQRTPVVVAGDFNASPAWPVYKETANRLTDLVAEWADEGDRSLEPTWGWRPGWPRMLRVDHVFGSGVRASDVSIQPIRGTDHAAVVVDLETRPP